MCYVRFSKKKKLGITATDVTDTNTTATATDAFVIGALDSAATLNKQASCLKPHEISLSIQ